VKDALKILKQEALKNVINRLIFTNFYFTGGPTNTGKKVYFQGFGTIIRNA